MCVLCLGQRLIDRYDLLEEHTRRALSYPSPLNVFFLLYEMVTFFWANEHLFQKYPETSIFRRFDLYLARNRSYLWFRRDFDNEDDGDHGERTIGNQISAFMERARMSVLEKDAKGNSLDSMMTKVDNIRSDTDYLHHMMKKQNERDDAQATGGE